MNKRGQRAVAFTGQFHRLAVAQQFRAALHDAVFAFRFKTFKLPGFGTVNVFLPKHPLQFGSADLAAKSVHFVICNRAEFTLHFLGQLDAEFTFKQIRHTALAGLRVNADNLAVFTPDVRRINGEIRHIPILPAFVRPLGETFFDGVLMRTSERGKNQFTRIRLSRRHRHARATLIYLND